MRFPILLAAATLPLCAFALKSYPMPNANNDLIGRVQYVHPEQGDHIYQITRRYNVGFYEMIEANPDMNRHSKLSTDETLKIPTQYVLPNVPRKGIVINLPELRLYYFNEAKHVVQTAPIAIGRFNWKTPEMTTRVIRKQKDPVWVVPKSIKEESARKGIHLPDVMPAGPENPLGEYMLRLGNWSYLIHGTNAPNSIGKRASSGCMRMFPESIEALFQAVPIDTQVQIINQPIKVGWENGELYMEAHEPLHEAAMSRHEEYDYAQGVIREMTQDHPMNVNWRKVDDVIEASSGIPTLISQGKASGPTPDLERDSSLLHGEIEYTVPNDYE